MVVSTHHFFAGFGKLKFLDIFFQYCAFINENSSIAPGSLKAGQNNNFLSFVRLIGCLYFKKYNSAFAERSPISQFKSLVSGDVASYHLSWLSKIRETVWEQCSDEGKDYLPSNEALKLHWMRCCWVANLWKQAVNYVTKPLPVDNHGWEFDNDKLCVKWDISENIQAVTQKVKQLHN